MDVELKPPGLFTGSLELNKKGAPARNQVDPVRPPPAPHDIELQMQDAELFSPLRDLVLNGTFKRLQHQKEQGPPLLFRKWHHWHFGLGFGA